MLVINVEQGRVSNLLVLGYYCTYLTEMIWSMGGRIDLTKLREFEGKHNPSIV